MNNIIAFISAGILGVILNNTLSKKNKEQIGGSNIIDLTKLQPNTKLIEEEGETIYAIGEKNKFFPMFKNPLNAKKQSPTKSVHLSVPKLMPASPSTWKDKSNDIYYMPNDLTPHFHGDAPHHKAKFDIKKVYLLSEEKFQNTKNKQLEKYRNVEGMKNFNNGKENTPIETWIHWRIPSDKKEYPNLRVRLNSIIWWDFSSSHNLAVVNNKDNYNNNEFKNSKVISKKAIDRQTLVTIMDKLGECYFACTVRGHAQEGHKILIQVVD